MWNTFHRPDLVRRALETTLKNLKTPYLDLYLIHWPQAFKEGDSLFPKDEKDNVLFSNVDFLDTWKEMEKAVDDGLVKSIGISNFNKRQIEKLLSSCGISPTVHQFESHPYLTQNKLSDYCISKGIVVTAYSPLGSPNRPWVTNNDHVLLDDPKVTKFYCGNLLQKKIKFRFQKQQQIVSIASKYNKTAAQVLIRYQIQRGHAVIPKSVTKARIISNFQVFDFELTADDMPLIDSFDCNGRICPMSM